MFGFAPLTHTPKLRLFTGAFFTNIPVITLISKDRSTCGTQDYYGRHRYIDPSSFRLAEDPNYKEAEKACFGIEDPEYYRECMKWWCVPGGNHFNGTNQLFLDGHVKWFPIIHIVGGAFAED